MLGDVGPYWTILVGLILLWVAPGYARCRQVLLVRRDDGQAESQGEGSAAFILGLAYGVLSGSCTFGFIAPILAIITVQEKVLTGVAFIVLFGIGHCIPIAVAGGSAAMVKKLLANSAWQRGGMLFRRIAGGVIGALGIYFIAKPFITAG